MLTTTAAKLIDIADRLARLAPCHRDPHRFHEEKSQLVHELRALAANDNMPARSVGQRQRL